MPQLKKLKTTPLREIIFTISYFEDVSKDSLKKFCENQQVANKFNHISDGYSARLKRPTEDIHPEASISNDGYILKCNSENKLIQARKGSFSFHKLNEYEYFDKLFQELLEYWNIFINSVNQKLHVTNISLRYLNFIELLANDTISQLVNIKPNNPFSEELTGYFIQLQFFDKQYKDVKVNLVSTVSTNKEKKEGIILDIIQNQKLNNITDYEIFNKKFHNMRTIKNNVFFTSITDYTVNRYSDESRP